jgi:hypothetical protein
MKLLLLGLVLILVVRCKPRTNTSTEHAVASIDSILHAFMNWTKEQKISDEIFVANLDKVRDTVRLTILNSYPNVRTTSFNLDTNMFGNRTIFTGEKIKGFSRNTLQSFPPDIVKKDIDEFASTSDFLEWVFYFKNGQIIGYYPKDQIDLYFQKGRYP